MPPPGKQGAKVLEVRGLINRLTNLIDPGTICRVCDVTVEDLHLLAMVEDELRESQQDKKEPDNG